MQLKRQQDTIPPAITNPAVVTGAPYVIIVDTKRPTTTSTLPVSLTTVPLTTTFTPPAFCHSSNNYFIAIDTSVLSVDDSPIRVCYPSGYRSAVYSPGVCPSGFQSLIVPPVGSLAGEHRALCCRGDLTINSNRCESMWTKTNEIITYMSYDHLRSSYVTTSGILNSSTVGHTPVEIRWRDGDFSSSTPRTGNPGDGSPPGTVPDNGGGLSTGAKAGIGIGAAIAILLLILVAFVLRRHKRKARDLGTGAELEGNQILELHNNDIKPKELDAVANMRHELEARGQDDRSGRQELEATPLSSKETRSKQSKDGKGQYNASFSYDGLPSWSSTSPVDTPGFYPNLSEGNNTALLKTPGAPEARLGGNNEPVNSSQTGVSDDAPHQDVEIERRLRELEEEEARIKAQKRNLLDLKKK
ncbi:hypothetical protein QBC38DRAFT_447816 [Podospora fimiseda]|uniref:Uncharacterized protein n=1 Tax=Podospora fimiseda TaxID=252190 RepID=A0AAN6YRU4_9PEZI|nr:hypothetical protein QBC38DRAFT_447816 [Podospora fimiseda]